MLIKRGKINNKISSQEKILDKSLVKLINEINVKINPNLFIIENQKYEGNVVYCQLKLKIQN